MKKVRAAVIANIFLTLLTAAIIGATLGRYLPETPYAVIFIIALGLSLLSFRMLMIVWRRK
jgi:hypothetical protein